VVLLDEPLSGLDILATDNLTAAFQRVVEQSTIGLSCSCRTRRGLGVGALKQDLVLDFGCLIAQGTPDEIRAIRRSSRLPRRRRSGGDGITRGAAVPEGKCRTGADVSEPMLKVEDLNVSYGQSQASSMCRWKYPPVCRRCARCQRRWEKHLGPVRPGWCLRRRADHVRWR